MRKTTSIRRRRVGAALCLAGLIAAGAACRRPRPLRAIEVLVPFLPGTLDPSADTRLVSRSIFSAVYEPLAEETALGIRPAIAESWTSPTPDSWVFRIAADTLFHDGTPVTSADVLAAVRGSRTSAPSLTGLADLKTVEAPDSRTVRFTTHAAAGDFLLALSALPISKRAGETFVGTGPYRVASRTPDLVVLRRHPRPGHARPLLEEVRFRRLADPAEGPRLLRERNDLAALDPTRAMVDAVRGDLRYRTVTTESGGVTYLAIGFPATPGPLGDVRVRQALRLAIDLPELTRTGTLAGGSPAAQLVPPGSFGYDPERTAPRRDPAKARLLLRAAGFPNGFDVPLDVSPNGRAAADALARQVAEAGIRLHVSEHPAEEFASRILGSSPLYLYSWFVGEDAGHALRNAFHTRDTARGLGTLNRTGFSSPAVDEALAALAATTDPQKRLRALRDLSALLDAELPWIPLFSAREVRILPAGIDLPSRPDGLFVVAEARAAPVKP